MDKHERMRQASYLLPDPGGEVVRELLDEIAALKDALEELMTWQNGPPLPTYADGWRAAMDKAETLLGIATGGEEG